MLRILKNTFTNKTYLYAVIIGVVAFMFMLNSLFTIQLKLENKNLNEQIFELENRLKSAQQEAEKLQTDIYIEQEATERLSMTKSNEMPIKVVEYEEASEIKEVKDEEKKEKIYIYLNEWYQSLKEKIEQK